MKNIIVFAVHADDEVLGCGATLSEYINLIFNLGKESKNFIENS